VRWLLVLVASVFALDARARPRFEPLGHLLGEGTRSEAYGVSADGSTAVGVSDSASGDQAFLWTTGGGMVGLGYLPGGGSSIPANRSAAFGVSADGSTVAGYSANLNNLFGTSETFSWTRGGGMIGLGYLPEAIGNYRRSAALGVSADGSTVIGFGASENRYEAMRWTSNGGMVLAGWASVSQADGVSADGSTVVGEGIGPSGREAFLWTSAGGMVGLGDLAGGEFQSFASSVSADGSTVVGFGTSANGSEAFLWSSSGGMVGLGDLAGGRFESAAKGVSADGSTVVGYGFSASGQEAFLWDTTNGMRELDQLLTGIGLDVTGWKLTEAKGISADGRTLVGYGTNPNGRTEAWMATLPDPEGPACNDGLDNDGDGFADFSDDLGCSGWRDPSENDPTLPCDDGADNDGDGAIDFLALGGGDPGCETPISVRENPKCQDGLNNDGETGIDFDGGNSLDIDPRDGFVDVQFNAATPAVGEADPQCVSAFRNSELPNRCGLGAELVLVMPLLGLAASRRRRAN